MYGADIPLDLLTKNIYVFLVSPMHGTCTNLILFDLMDCTDIHWDPR